MSRSTPLTEAQKYVSEVTESIKQKIPFMSRGTDDTAVQENQQHQRLMDQNHIYNKVQNYSVIGQEGTSEHMDYLEYMNSIAPYYQGRNFPSQQSIYSRNSFATTDPVMKKFGVNVAQDGVAEFIPQVNMQAHDHLFEQRQQQQEHHQKLLAVNGMVPDDMKKEFYSPSHFFEGVPQSLALRQMHINFTRQRQEDFYAFV